MTKKHKEFLTRNGIQDRVELLDAPAISILEKAFKGECHAFFDDLPLLAQLDDELRNAFHSTHYKEEYSEISSRVQVKCMCHSGGEFQAKWGQELGRAKRTFVWIVFDPTQWEQSGNAADQIQKYKAISPIFQQYPLKVQLRNALPIYKLVSAIRERSLANIPSASCPEMFSAEYLQGNWITMSGAIEVFTYTDRNFQAFRELIGSEKQKFLQLGSRQFGFVLAGISLCRHTNQYADIIKNIKQNLQLGEEWEVVDANDRLSVEWPAVIVFVNHKVLFYQEGTASYGELCLALSRARMKLVLIVHQEDYEKCLRVICEQCKISHLKL